jgi:hypothetical protein
MQAMVMLSMGPQGRHRDNAIVGPADRAQVLARHVVGSMTILATARILNAQHATGQRLFLRGRR